MKLTARLARIESRMPRHPAETADATDKILAASFVRDLGIDDLRALRGAFRVLVDPNNATTEGRFAAALAARISGGDAPRGLTGQEKERLARLTEGWRTVGVRVLATSEVLRRKDLTDEPGKVEPSSEAGT